MRSFVAAVLLVAGSAARAGEDTDTPGAGRWEINMNVSGERSSPGWLSVIPQAEVNYGWGERLQLGAGVERLIAHPRGESSQSALGPATVGAKWRFYEDGASGRALAVFPTYSWNPSSAAVRKGLAEPGHSLMLPLIAGFRRGEWALFVSAGRNIVSSGADEWQAGLKATRQCLPTVECRLELEHSQALRQEGHTQAGAGFKWAVVPDLILQASVGRDIGPSRPEKHQLVILFGIQLLR